MLSPTRFFCHPRR